MANATTTKQLNLLEKVTTELSNIDNKYILANIVEKICDSCHFLLPYQIDQRDLAEMRLMKITDKDSAEHTTQAKKLNRAEEQIAQITPIFDTARALYKEIEGEVYVNYKDKK